jgi:hypothetical protein
MPHTGSGSCVGDGPVVGGHDDNDMLHHREPTLPALNAALAQQVAERTALLALLQAITAAANVP